MSIFGKVKLWWVRWKMDRMPANDVRIKCNVWDVVIRDIIRRKCKKDGIIIVEEDC